MTAPSLPGPVADLAAQLADLPGVVAVVLGGSRATGTQRPESDWDLGLYYRGRQPFDPNELRRLGHPGHVAELGDWGPIMDGGAWLTIDDTPIDGLFRDLDRVERWIDDADQGRFQVLTQNGYIVGAPTYLPVGELALCRPITGELPRPAFPDQLAATACTRWLGRASVCLMFARGHAHLGDVVACSGMLVQAALCVAHARLADRHEWVLNEKRLVRRAGLQGIEPLVASPGADGAELGATVAAAGRELGIAPLATR
jgi:predicted nucleotidyltransferase